MNASFLPLATLAALVTLAQPLTAQAEPPKVVGSIAPVHSITAAIMKGVAEPTLLTPPSSSPHVTTLLPSSAVALQDADLVVWVGPEIEPAMTRPIENLASNAVSLSLIKLDDLTILPVREGGEWEKHDHDHADNEDAHEDEKQEHSEHAHNKNKHEQEEDHKDQDEHVDAHIWLDPANGLVIAAAVSEKLSQLDPEHAETYQANLQAFKEKLNRVEQNIRPDLEKVSAKPFIVFHDAYQYFENRFGLNATGSVLLQPGVSPGAAQVREIRHKLEELEAACLFAEPQFSSKILSSLLEGTQAKFGHLDPIGAELEVGPDLYPDLIAYNAKQIIDCLK